MQNYYLDVLTRAADSLIICSLTLPRSLNASHQVNFNINFLCADPHNPTSEFIDLTYSNSFYLLISKPTRMISHTLKGKIF